MANTTTIGQFKSGQMVTTIPRAIAQAIRLNKGDKVEWLFDRGDIVVRKV